MKVLGGTFRYLQTLLFANFWTHLSAQYSSNKNTSVLVLLVLESTFTCSAQVSFPKSSLAPASTSVQLLGSTCTYLQVTVTLTEMFNSLNSPVLEYLKVLSLTCK